MISRSVADASAITPADGGVRSRIRSGLLLAAGTLLLIYYLQGLDYSGLLLSASRFSVGIAAAVVGINLLPGGIKYARWRYFLSERGLGVEGWRGYLAVNASFFLGLVTPGTAGELSRAWVEDTPEAGRATAVVAFEKLTDLVVLLLLVAGSAAVQFTGGLRSWAVVAAALAGVVGLYAVFLRYDGLVTTPVKYLLERAISEERRTSLRDVYWEFYEVLEDRRLVLLSAVASAALWLVTLAQMHLIFTGLEWELPLKTTALALFLPYLLGVISLIPLGLGVFEVVMSRAMELGVVAGVAGGAASGPLFFRFLVTLPLVLFGYGCHLALTIHRRRSGR